MIEFKYCPVCGGKLVIKTLDEMERLVCNDCGYVHYINSKPCVAVLVEKDGRLMLTRRIIEPFNGWWDLPGGFLEDGEHPEDGACREVEEETGLKIKVKELTGIIMDDYGDTGIHTMNLHYLAEPVFGEEHPASDVGEIKWFLPGEIPNEIAFANCREGVKNWAKSKKADQ